jgi:hypothetical protein
MYARLMMTAAYDVFGGRTTSSARRERARLIDPIAIAGRYRGSMIGPDERLHEPITLNNEAVNEAVTIFGAGRKGQEFSWARLKITPMRSRGSCIPPGNGGLAAD